MQPEQDQPPTSAQPLPPWGPGALCFLSGFAPFCQDRGFVPRRHSPAHGISALKAAEETWAPETGPPKRSVSTQHSHRWPMGHPRPLHPALSNRTPWLVQGLPFPIATWAPLASLPKPALLTGGQGGLAPLPAVSGFLQQTEASALSSSSPLPSASSGGLLPPAPTCPCFVPQLWALPPSLRAACLLSWAPQRARPTEVPPPCSHLTPG